MAPYRTAIMDEDIGEFLSDNMQQRTKNHEKERSSLRTLKVNILICNVLVFFKKLLCGLRSSCLRLNVNRCNCKKGRRKIDNLGDCENDRF